MSILFYSLICSFICVAIYCVGFLFIRNSEPGNAFIAGIISGIVAMFICLAIFHIGGVI